TDVRTFDLKISDIIHVFFYALMFFFFFQAEDGIRYATVTGVQTCALPISLYEPVALFVIDQWKQVGITATHDVKETSAYQADLRSEERRVGKNVELGSGGTTNRKKI